MEHAKDHDLIGFELVDEDIGEVTDDPFAGPS
jgi:hypothetical protein